MPSGSVSSSSTFLSSQTRATCYNCFVRQSICSVISLHSDMSRAVHPQVFCQGGCRTNIDTCQSGFPFRILLFCCKLIEPVRIMACVVWLSPLEAIQGRACVTARFHLQVQNLRAICAAGEILRTLKSYSGASHWQCYIRRVS